METEWTRSGCERGSEPRALRRAARATRVTAEQREHLEEPGADRFSRHRDTRRRESATPLSHLAPPRRRAAPPRSTRRRTSRAPRHAASSATQMLGHPGAQMLLDRRRVVLDRHRRRRTGPASTKSSSRFARGFSSSSTAKNHACRSPRYSSSQSPAASNDGFDAPRELVGRQPRRCAAG